MPDGYAIAVLPLPANGGNGAVVVETGNPTEALHQLTNWAARRSVILAGLTVDRPSLEDVYLQLTHDGAVAIAPAGSTR